jgi:hypothetical protein
MDKAAHYRVYRPPEPTRARNWLSARIRYLVSKQHGIITAFQMAYLIFCPFVSQASHT